MQSTSVAVTTRTPQQQLLHERRAAAFSAKRRDPRAAPVAFRTNVSVPETCAFYGLADSITGCRVPRSCQDCLEMPGCGLSTVGDCRNVTEDPSYFSVDLDYRNATFPDDSVMTNTSSFIFLAETATYCAASDPVCIQCREEFQRLATTGGFYSSSRDVRTQFCKGDNGCVCIGTCEVSGERDGYVYDTTCGQPTHHNSRHSIRPRVSRQSQRVRSEPRSPAVKAIANRRETCEYTAEVDIRGCRRPRTCRDCLNKTGCILDSTECTDALYRSDLDFRKATLNQNNRSGDRGKYSFLSSEVKYCAASDIACATCRGYRDFYSDFYTGSYFCVGQDGCVCVEGCETSQWEVTMRDKECLQLPMDIKVASPGTTVTIAVVIWVVLWFVYKLSTSKPNSSYNQRREERGGGLWRQMLDEVPALPRLDLFGWRAHHEELYYREQELLHGLEITAVRPPVDFDNIDPSAPDFEEDDASAPTAQDPKALASAPIYRCSFGNGESSSSSSCTQDTDHSTPTAPDFELEESSEVPAQGCSRVEAHGRSPGEATSD